MGATHTVNPLASRRHLLQTMPRPPRPTLYAHGRTFRARGDALHYGMRSGSPDTGYTAYQRSDGTWVPIVLLREDQFWMQEHVNWCGCVAYPAEYELPATPGEIPKLKAV